MDAGMSFFIASTLGVTEGAEPVGESGGGGGRGEVEGVDRNVEGVEAEKEEVVVQEGVERGEAMEVLCGAGVEGDGEIRRRVLGGERNILSALDLSLSFSFFFSFSFSFPFPTEAARLCVFFFSPFKRERLGTDSE